MLFPRDDQSTAGRADFEVHCCLLLSLCCPVLLLPLEHLSTSFLFLLLSPDSQNLSHHCCTCDVYSCVCTALPDGNFPWFALHFIHWNGVSQLNPELTDLAGLARQTRQRESQPSLCCWNYRYPAISIQHSHVSWEPISSPHLCTASAGCPSFLPTNVHLISPLLRQWLRRSTGPVSQRCQNLHQDLHFGWN